MGKRLLVIGSPRSGKTTFASGQISLPGSPYGNSVLHTDAAALIMGWSETSNTIVKWISQSAPWVIEGCAGVRALRKWLDQFPGKPCDNVVWMGKPLFTLSKGQETMRKGCETIWMEIKDEVAKRGVSICNWPVVQPIF